jgi:type IV pilus assembly protein PilE
MGIGRKKAALGLRLQARAAARGFTLIELAIVCVVVAILAATAVTSYEWATVSARRSAAQGCLIEHAQFMERYYTTEMTFEGAPEPACSTDVTPHYVVRFVGVPTATTYSIEAVPEGRQKDVEKKCGTMTIDQIGRKSPTNTDCW